MNDGVRLDLFGEDIPSNRGKRGRPAHARTVENARKIQIAAALGHSEDDCAGMLGITMPTLRKHYFFELEGFRRARMNMRMKIAAALVAEIEKGNVAAGKELLKQIDRGDALQADKSVKARGAEKVKPVGLKEQRKEAARTVKGMFELRSPPSAMN